MTFKLQYTDYYYMHFNYFVLIKIPTGNEMNQTLSLKVSVMAANDFICSKPIYNYKLLYII